jgi:hypothetical protein
MWGRLPTCGGLPTRLDTWKQAVQEYQPGRLLEIDQAPFVAQDYILRAASPQTGFVTGAHGLVAIVQAGRQQSLTGAGY